MPDGFSNWQAAHFTTAPSLPSVAHGRPDLARGQRQVEMRDAERGQRVEDGVGDGRRGADGGRLADALHAERRPWRGRARVVVLERRQVFALRQRVLHQRRGEELAVLVEGGALPERLPDTLSE